MTGATRNLSRRGFIGASALGGTALLLPGCGRQDAPTTGGDGSFSWANWSDAPATSQLYIDLLDQYAADNGVEIDRQANVSFDDYNTRFRTLLAGGQPPDAMRLNDDFLRELQDADQLYDTAPLIEQAGLDVADYFPEVWDFGTVDGRHLAMTVGLSPRVIFYNRTAFEDEGVPLPPSTWTSEGWMWDDFLDAARALTRGTERYGCQLCLDSGNEQAWAANNGGDGIFSADGRSFSLARGENLEAMQWLADLSLQEGVQPPWAEIQAENAAYDRFGSQQDMMRSGPMSDLRQMQEIATGFEVGIAPLPGQVAQLQNGGLTLFVIPAAARNPQPAFDFLAYLCGPDGGAAFADSAVFVPVNRQAADSLDEEYALFREAADNQTTTNSTAATSQAVALYRPQLQLAFGGGASVQDALGGVADQIDSILQG